MTGHLKKSVDFLFWFNGPKFQPFLIGHLIQPVYLFVWLSIGYPNQVFLYGYLAIVFSLAGVEEAELTFITA